MTITIGANEKLSEALTAEDFAQLMDWFHASHIDPSDVALHEPVIIDTDPAIATIDYWSFGLDIPQAAKAVELRWVDADRKLAHVVAPIHRMLPDHLAEVLTDMHKTRIAERARIAGRIAAAEAEAKVWQEAGY